jgi:uncharacterized membrane protein YqjE
MPEAAGGAGRQAGGLLDSLKALARSLLAMGQTRLEILGSEIEEQRSILLREVLLAIIAAFCLGLGIVFAALFFVFLFWDDPALRLAVICIFALVFLVAAAVLFFMAREVGRDRPRIFSATTEELARDRETLR